MSDSDRKQKDKRLIERIQDIDMQFFKREKQWMDFLHSCPKAMLVNLVNCYQKRMVKFRKEEPQG